MNILIFIILLLLSLFLLSISLKPEKITYSQIKKIPKVILHDHIDGGVRPTTLYILSQKRGLNLPENAEELKEWILQQTKNQANLTSFLKLFEYTKRVMQTSEEITRISREAVLDLAKDGTVYAELFLAPQLHTREGLTIDEVIKATLNGVNEGMEIVNINRLAANKREEKIRVKIILVGIRGESLETVMKIVRETLNYQGRGVVGFNLAGDEDLKSIGYYGPVFEFLSTNNIPYSIHTGETGKIEHVRNTLKMKPKRIGNTLDLDIERNDDVLSQIKKDNIIVELCPTCNQFSSGYKLKDKLDLVDKLYKKGVNVSVNTDNRLFSGVNVSDELWELVQDYNWTLDDLEKIMIININSSFIRDDEKKKIIKERIIPGFQKIRKNKYL